ncbi:MAG: PKD domain-containing protein [Verrucomicrobiae bacterium]|nr:PKD domain-containing protein [Verrucomicrobiae bacterium]
MKETFRHIIGRALATTVTLIATVAPATDLANVTIAKMPTLGGTYGAIVYDMNAAGQLTGFSYRPGNTSVHAFLSDGGEAVDLGTLGGVVSQGFAINATGQVAGEANLAGDSATHAVLFSDGTILDLGTLGGSFSSATAINAGGEIAGRSLTTGDQTIEAFLYSDGAMISLGTLGGSFSTAVAINDSGAIAGDSETEDFEDHAFLHTDGTMIDLGTLGGSYSSARALNNAGMVVGESDLANGEIHGFLYANGVMTDLGTLGGDYSTAYGLNELGQVIGAATTASGEWHGFIYENGTLTDLETLGGGYTDPFAINNLGHVVGHSTTDTGSLHAFLWRDGTIVDLNEWLPSESGWELISAQFINDSGRIVGFGIYDESFEWFILQLPTGANQPPVAMAGPDQTTACSEPVTLDGSLSSDPDGDPLTFAWSMNGSIVGTEAQLTAYFLPGTHLLTLTVSDPHGASAQDEVVVTSTDLTAPTIVNSPAALVVPADANCEGIVPNVVASIVATDNCTPAEALLITQSPTAGSLLSVGSYTITVTVRDAAGNEATTEVALAIADVTPPSISSVTASPEALTPPNNKLIPVEVAVIATDTCDSSPLIQIISITANGPVAPGDITITGALTATLAAKKNPGGNERIYTIIVSCTDASGNSSTGTVTVKVPQNAGGGQGNAKGKAE